MRFLFCQPWSTSEAEIHRSPSQDPVHRGRYHRGGITCHRAPKRTTWSARGSTFPANSLIGAQPFRTVRLTEYRLHLVVVVEARGRAGRPGRAGVRTYDDHGNGVVGVLPHAAIGFRAVPIGVRAGDGYAEHLRVAVELEACMCRPMHPGCKDVDDGFAAGRGGPPDHHVAQTVRRTGGGELVEALVEGIVALHVAVGTS